MKCPNCGMELVDGASFCGNCGAKIEYQRNEERRRKRKRPEEFCPNCGKPIKPEDLFCDECGYDLKGKQLPHSRKKLPLLCAGIIVLALVVAGGFHIFKNLGRSSEKKSEFSKVFYYKDNSLMMTDVKKKKVKPVEITDSFLKSSYSENYRPTSLSSVSKDGKYLAFIEDYDGDTFDLYLTPVSDPSKKVEVDSRVESYEILKDNSIVYVKKGALYHYENEKKDTYKFGKNVGAYAFGLDKEQKNIYWSEEQNGETKYYLQDLAGKKEAVMLGKGFTWFSPEKNFSYFYAKKDDDLYIVSPSGDKEKITKDVDSVYKHDRKNGTILYTKKKETEIPYKDIVNRKAGNLSSWEQQKLETGTYSYTQYSLWFYDGKKENCLTENFLDRECYELSDAGNYILFYEVPSIEELSIDQSDLLSGSGTAINNALEENKILVYCNGSERIKEYEVENCQTRINADAGKLYLYEYENDPNNGEDSGQIYEANLNGKDAGVLREYDTAENCWLLFATEEGLYYKKDCDDSSGELFLNGKKIASDVYQAYYVGSSENIVYSQDYDEDDDSKTFVFWNGSKNVTVANDAYLGQCLENGTAIVLTDYSSDSREGTLMYFDGKKLNTLDTDVAEFVRQSDATNMN